VLDQQIDFPPVTAPVAVEAGGACRHAPRRQRPEVLAIVQPVVKLPSHFPPPTTAVVVPGLSSSTGRFGHGTLPVSCRSSRDTNSRGRPSRSGPVSLT